MDYIIYKFVCFLGSHLPINLSYFISRRVAELRYYSSSFWRKNIKNNITENLRIVLQYKSRKEGTPFTEKELKETVKESYYHFARYMTDFFSVSKNKQKFVNKTKVIGIEHLKKALSFKNGVIVLTAHLGNWELAGVMTVLLGFPLSAIAFPFRSKNIAKLFQGIRKNVGINVIETGAHPKEILKALRRNEVIAVLGDRVFTEKGTKIDFMGKPAILPRGPATLAVKTRAKYIAGFLVYNKDTYTLLFQDFNEPPQSVSDNEKIQFYLEEGKKTLEKYILEYPFQWLNFSSTWNI